MATKTLATKYRPSTFDDVTEQGSIKTILTQEIATGTTKNAYLFTGGAGTGKTTCARIFANELNCGKGNPIEMDAASNSGVDDVREIIQQAQTKSLTSEYKVFIIDECHSISNTGWQAFLKLIEEPPAKSVFIFCTTDPQKIPKTIISRVERYDFQRISLDGIVNRLKYIIECENEEISDKSVDTHYQIEAIEMIAKMADGGMRDAITLLDKCISYSNNLTEENVINALGTTDYGTMFNITNSFFNKDCSTLIEKIESIHESGKDLKQFVRTYMTFMLDVAKYRHTKSFRYIHIPTIYEDELKTYGDYEYDVCNNLLKVLIKLNADVKWDTSPKSLIEATLISEV